MNDKIKEFCTKHFTYDEKADTFTFAFLGKDEYLAFRAEWRSLYRELSEGLRAWRLDRSQSVRAKLNHRIKMPVATKGSRVEVTVHEAWRMYMKSTLTREDTNALHEMERQIRAKVREILGPEPEGMINPYGMAAKATFLLKARVASKVEAGRQRALNEKPAADGLFYDRGCILDEGKVNLARSFVVPAIAKA